MKCEGSPATRYSLSHPDSLHHWRVSSQTSDWQTDLQSGQTSKQTGRQQSVKRNKFFTGGSRNSRDKPSALSVFEEQIALDNLFYCSLNQFMHTYEVCTSSELICLSVCLSVPPWGERALVTQCLTSEEEMFFRGSVPSGDRNVLFTKNTDHDNPGQRNLLVLI